MAEYYARYLMGYGPNRKHIKEARRDGVSYLNHHPDTNRVAIMKETTDNIVGVGDIRSSGTGKTYRVRKTGKTYKVKSDGSLIG